MFGNKRTVKVAMVLCLTFFIVIMTGCMTNKNAVKTAQITSIINSKDSLQENAFYNFDNGNLDVTFTLSVFQAPNANPADPEYEKNLDKTLKSLNKEFPNEKITKENFENPFEKTFKNVTFSVEKEKKKVVIDGKDVHKEFTMSDSNENRLTDNLGNEYELKYSE